MLTASPGLSGFDLAYYQGSKRRIQAAVVDALEARFGSTTSWKHFYDVCAGTGAVSREVRSRAPRLPITMVDMGVWGRFWTIYAAQPDAVKRHLMRLLPPGTARGDACRLLKPHPPSKSDTLWAAQLLVMLGGALYAKHTDPHAASWDITCQTSTKGGAGAPYMIRDLDAMGQFTAIWGRGEDTKFSRNAVVYIDPDYHATSGYRKGGTCDVPLVVQHAKQAGARVAVSHHGPYPGLKASLVTVAAELCSPKRNRAAATCRSEVLLFP